MKALSITESAYLEAVDCHQGYCTDCREFTHDTAEPDAEEYECPDCLHNTVYGAEQALLMGILEIG